MRLYEATLFDDRKDFWRRFFAALADYHVFIQNRQTSETLYHYWLRITGLDSKQLQFSGLFEELLLDILLFEFYWKDPTNLQHFDDLVDYVERVLQSESYKQFYSGFIYNENIQIYDYPNKGFVDFAAGDWLVPPDVFVYTFCRYLFIHAWDELSPKIKELISFTEFFKQQIGKKNDLFDQVVYSSLMLELHLQSWRNASKKLVELTEILDAHTSPREPVFIWRKLEDKLGRLKQLTTSCVYLPGRHFMLVLTHESASKKIIFSEDGQVERFYGKPMRLILYCEPKYANGGYKFIADVFTHAEV